MNRYFVTVSALAMLMAGPALAADNAQQKNATEADVKVIESGDANVKVIREGESASTAAGAQGAANQNVNVQERSGANTQAAATQQQPGQVDADKLIGQNIENAEGESIGEINSVILSQNGKVEAVIVGVGGFLGIGQRDVAINWDELNIAAGGEEIVANMSREELEQLPEYEFAENQERGSAFQRDMAAAPEGRQGQAAERDTAAVTVVETDRARSSETGTSGTAVGGDTAVTTGTTAGAGGAAMTGARTDTAAAGAQPMNQLSQMSADELIGKDVKNLRGEEVGDIEDIVMDQNNASFAVISVGGFLGIGARDVAIPLDELQLGEDDVIMMSEATEDQLKEMPEYDKSQYRPIEREATTR